jgi:methyl-accepting chemotaxis protein
MLKQLAHAEAEIKPSCFRHFALIPGAGWPKNLDTGSGRRPLSIDRVRVLAWARDTAALDRRLRTNTAMRLLSFSLPRTGSWVTSWSGIKAIREFFAYHGVWAVGVRLLRSLAIRNKILAVLGLVALPLFPTTTYMLMAESKAVALADRNLTGARLVTAIADVYDHLHHGAARLARLETVDEAALQRAIAQLHQARDEALAQGLDIGVAWEGVVPSLARLDAGRALSVQGRAKAFAGAAAELERVLVVVVDTAGLLLTSEPTVLRYAQLTYADLSRADEVLWAFSEALHPITHGVGSQAEASHNPGSVSSVMALAGLIAEMDRLAQGSAWKLLRDAAVRDPATGEVRTKGDAPEATGQPAAEEAGLPDLKALAQVGRRALLDDGQVTSAEREQIALAETAAADELSQVRQAGMTWLTTRYREQRQAAHGQRVQVMVGTAISLALAFYLFYAFYLVMRGGLSTLNQQMARVAQGDLSLRARARGGDEVGETMRAAALAVERLSELLAQVRFGASSVSQEAQQIAQGNGDLRSRNHRTAESLRKVVEGVARYSQQLEACSLQVERVVTTVQQLRLQSSRGRRQMDRLRESLVQVRQQSQQITDSVSLIDNIAFRTNILALNASVEAHKAGESGRGFAVVAQEVRSLAMRSAEASRRIGKLVRDSGEDIEQSGLLAEDAGKSIAESDNDIDAIHHAMGDVATLTREGQEESTAILEQVRSLRETSEKNLGLVEQLANASHSLRSHGERLTSRLSSFKLG